MSPLRRARELTPEERSYLRGWALAAVVLARERDGEVRAMLARGGVLVNREVYTGELSQNVGLTDFDRGNADAYLAAWGMDA